MKHGTITRWIQSKRLGFIQPDDGGEDVFFTFGSFCDSDEHTCPAAGQRVEYRPAVNSRGAASFHVRILPELPEAA